MNRRFRALAAAIALAVPGWTACSDDDNGTGPTLPAPTGLTVTQLSLTSARVSWNAVTGASGYELERADATAPGVFTQVGGTLSQTSFDDTGLTEGVTYSYRVAAVAGSGTSEYSGVVAFATGVQSGTLSGDITADRTLFADTLYTLSGFVKVTNGATLTIQPGTTIVGDAAVPSSSLWILRGAKILAMGTAQEPIVFTSAQSAGSRRPGDWGGIIIIGNGIINRTGATILTEGPANAAENYAGGTDNADSSGVLRYVRIEFAGFDVSNGAGQELNSLSMYGVGRGTKLEYVQSMAGLDDSFEWWGGAVQGRYLLSYESGDDHFDWSEGYQGKLQHIIAFQSTRLQPAPGSGTFSSDPRGIEADGCDPGVAGCTLTSTGTSAPFSNPTIANFTLVGTGDLGGFPTDGNGVVLRRGTAAILHNGIIARYKGVGCQMRDAFTDSLRVRDSLQINNIVFAENTSDYDTDPTRYCTATSFSASNHQSTAIAADIFTSLNPAGLDFTPPASSLPTSGGNTVTLPAARASGFFGSAMSGTTYIGAADPAGPKWWQGWSVYLVN